MRFLEIILGITALASMVAAAPVYVIKFMKRSKEAHKKKHEVEFELTDFCSDQRLLLSLHARKSIMLLSTILSRSSYASYVENCLLQIRYRWQWAFHLLAWWRQQQPTQFRERIRNTTCPHGYCDLIYSCFFYGTVVLREGCECVGNEIWFVGSGIVSANFHFLNLIWTLVQIFLSLLRALKKSPARVRDWSTRRYFQTLEKIQNATKIYKSYPSYFHQFEIRHRASLFL